LVQVIAGLHVLGDPVGEGGLGDEQAVRALMQLVRTARWLNEILLLDLDPLIAIDGLPPDAGAVRRREAALPANQARRRPETILVDEEIVAIIRAQQEPVRNRIASSRVVLR
jgi:hypothetical protein